MTCGMRLEHLTGSRAATYLEQAERCQTNLSGYSGSNSLNVAILVQSDRKQSIRMVDRGRVKGDAKCRLRFCVNHRGRRDGRRGCRGDDGGK